MGTWEGNSRNKLNFSGMQMSLYSNQKYTHTSKKKRTPAFTDILNVLIYSVQLVSHRLSVSTFRNLKEGGNELTKLSMGKTYFTFVLLSKRTSPQGNLSCRKLKLLPLFKKKSSKTVVTNLRDWPGGTRHLANCFMWRDNGWIGIIDPIIVIRNKYP